MVIAGVPADLVESEEECRARVRLVLPDRARLCQAGRPRGGDRVLRARAGGAAAANPFGPRVSADDVRGRRRHRGSRARGRAARPRDGPVAAVRVGLDRRAAGTAPDHLPGPERPRPARDLGARRRARSAASELGADRYEDARSMAAAGDARCRRWRSARGIGRPSGSCSPVMRPPGGRRSRNCWARSRPPRAPRNVSVDSPMRYGMDADATYRVAAIVPGPEADPTPEEPGMDDADLEVLAGQDRQLLRRRGSRRGPHDERDPGAAGHHVARPDRGDPRGRRPRVDAAPGRAPEGPRHGIGRSGPRLDGDRGRGERRGRDRSRAGRPAGGSPGRRRDRPPRRDRRPGGAGDRAAAAERP